MPARWSPVVLLVLTVVSGVLLRGAQLPVGNALPALGEIVRLDKAEAERLAADARAKLNLQIADGLELSLWAPERLIVDPVAIELEPDGTMYVASTSRNNLPLDIRQHQDWMTPAHTLKTDADLRRFYERLMTPANSEKNTWIPDLNGDGVRDIADMKEVKERLYRLRDTDGDGRADESRIVYEGFNDDPTWDIFGGLIAHEGDIIAGVPPGVYRLRDTDGDGVYDQRTPIAEGFNIHPAFGGHGVSGVTIGPDGRLYWEVGDIGLYTVDKDGRAWNLSNRGAVVRSEIDGSGFEVFASGIRNLQEFSFSEYGDLISVDNDGDHQGEFERLVYLPYGSDSGWRSTWQYGKYTDPKNNRYNVWMREEFFKPRHDGQASHILPPIENWHAGPSGMVYNPGTALSDEWARHYFVSSFQGSAAGARVYGFTLEPKGAGFVKGEEKVVTRGVLVVGMKIGADGALYLTDWVSGWDSKDTGRIWRLDAPAARDSAVRREVQALLRASFTDRPVDGLVTLLRHADMRVRQKAQFELVRRGDVTTLAATAGDRSHQFARLHAMWGIAQLARREAAHAARLVPFLDDTDPAIRAHAARLLGDARHAPAADRLVRALTDAEPRVRFFAAEALGRLAHRPAVAPIVAMLAENASRDMYLQHTGAAALAAIGDASAIEALRTHESTAVRLAAVVALRRLRHPGVAGFLTDRDPQVVTDAARAINDDGGITEAVPALAAQLGQGPVTNEPFLRRAINANVRVGTPAAVARVEAFASAPDTPAALRVEAIAALGTWADPSPTDRVDGSYHFEVTVPSTPAPARATATDPRNAFGQPGIMVALDPPSRQPGTRVRREGTAARQAVERLVTAQASRADADVDVLVALAEAAGHSRATAVASALRTQLESHSSALVRTAALRGLQGMRAPDLGARMRTALADKDATVRRAALALLPSVAMPEPAKVQLLDDLLAKGQQAEQQGAFEALGAMKSAASRRILERQLEELEAGRLPEPLRIDLVSAIRTDGSASLTRRLERYQQAQQADALILAFRQASLTGGDARRGQQIFNTNPLAECTRCHAIRGRGSDVGPELTRIGASLSREQIFEALVEPDKRIAPGYGTVSVTLTNGETVNGSLREETDDALVVMVGTPPVERRILRAQVAERTDPISAMPPLGLLLEPRDVRDLIEFLSALR